MGVCGGRGPPSCHNENQSGSLGAPHTMYATWLKQCQFPHNAARYKQCRRLLKQSLDMKLWAVKGPCPPNTYILPNRLFFMQPAGKGMKPAPQCVAGSHLGTLLQTGDQNTINTKTSIDQLTPGIPCRINTDEMLKGC